MALADLQSIRDKVRRITRSPSNAQIDDAQLDDYINTFLLYNLPSELRLFNLRVKLNFYTQPFKDVYETTTIDPEDPLYNFKNKYITVHPQVYMAGVPSTFTQYRDVFYGQWPQTNAVVNTGLIGNGTTGPFSGIVNTAVTTPNPGIPQQPMILKNSLIFTALDTAGTAMVLVDYPQNNLTGLLGTPNQIDVTTNPFGTINYLTGAYTFTFPNTTLISSNTLPNPIWVEYVPYVAGKPIAMLYFQDQFTIRPVPDRAYLIQLEADIRPTELLLGGHFPELEQWWQFIAVGASKIIFEDRMDMESVAMILPLFREQMNYVSRTTLVQTANMRTNTIYTNNLRNTWGWLGSNWPY